PGSPAAESRVRGDRRARGSGHAGSASGLAGADTFDAEDDTTVIRRPHASRAHSPGCRRKLCPRTAGAQSGSEGKIFLASRPVGRALREPVLPAWPDSLRPEGLPTAKAMVRKGWARR